MSAEQGTLRDYQERRLGEILGNTGTPKWTAGHFTFFISNEPETVRRSKLPSIAPPGITERLGFLRYDGEGRLYQPRWLEINKVTADLVPLGRTQRGRDYVENPPRTQTWRQIMFDYIPAGADVALRRAEGIRGKYRVQPDQDSDNREAWQVVQGLDRLTDLRRQAMGLKNLSEEKLKDIFQQNTDFLRAHGLLNPRLKDKQKVRDMLLKGFVDSKGRRNYLVALTRLFSVELRLRKRLEIAFPHILTKYSANIEMIRFERDTTRSVMETAVQKLEALMGWSDFSDPTVAEQPEQVRLEHARAVFKELGDISSQLQAVRVRPYVLGSRRAVELLGTRNLPKGTISRMLQERHQEREVLTVHEYLRLGDFDMAGRLIEQSKVILQRVLAKNADYQSVKLSRRPGLTSSAALAKSDIVH